MLELKIHIVFVFNNVKYVLSQLRDSTCKGWCSRAGGLGSNIESIVGRQ